LKASANAGAKKLSNNTPAASAATGAGEDRAAAEDGPLQERVQCLYGGQELRHEVIATSETGIKGVGAKSLARRRGATRRRDCKELNNEKRNVKSTC
jgi:hypothetical protein